MTAIDKYFRYGDAQYRYIDSELHKNYTCVLNQTDINKNTNKFYIMQIIECNNKYIHYIRYGRVGDIGVMLYNDYNDIEIAIKGFCKQFKLKTGNTWCGDDISLFKPKEKKYILLDMEKSIIKENDKNETNDKTCELNPIVIDLIKIISDNKMLQNSMMGMNINLKKLPLGRISNKQIDDAKLILDEIKNEIETNNDLKILENKSSMYYTYIPFKTERRNKPPIINNIDIINKYYVLLDELKNISEVSYAIENYSINEMYINLNTIIDQLDVNTDIYNELTKYILNTQCKTHHYTLKINMIYKIIKQNHNYDNKNGNEHLLFHGSPICNWYSILKNGLLLDPSKLNVRITGKMFGYGIYWANAITKSYNYCMNNDISNKGIIAVGRVALGNQLKLKKSNVYLNKQYLDEYGYDSTWGIGNSTPESHTILDDLIIPNGIIIEKNKQNELLYDEFIIYDDTKYKFEYLILLEHQFI